MTDIGSVAGHVTILRAHFAAILVDVSAVTGNVGTFFCRIGFIAFSQILAHFTPIFGDVGFVVADIAAFRVPFHAIFVQIALILAYITTIMTNITAVMPDIAPVLMKISSILGSVALAEGQHGPQQQEDCTN